MSIFSRDEIPVQEQYLLLCLFAYLICLIVAELQINGSGGGDTVEDESTTSGQRDLAEEVSQTNSIYG